MGLRGRAETVTPSLGTIQVLVVACGKTYVAIPATIIRGIVESADAIHARIVSLLGQTCQVTDLASRLDLAPCALTADTRIVLCGEDRARQTWRVDRAFGLTDVEIQRIMPLPSHFAGEERNWFTGLFLFRNTVALTLSAEWLLSQTMETSETDSSACTVTEVLSAGGEVVHASNRADGEAASFEILENLVLEESKDAEDSEVPWA